MQNNYIPQDGLIKSSILLSLFKILTEMLNIFFCIRECYVTVEEMESAKKFKSAINRSFNEKGGVFWKGLTDDQVATYTMEKVQQFIRTGGKKLKATLLIGRQPNPTIDGVQVEQVGNQYDVEDDSDSAVYILNEKIQVNI